MILFTAMNKCNCVRHYSCDVIKRLLAAFTVGTCIWHGKRRTGTPENKMLSNKIHDFDGVSLVLRKRKMQATQN